MILRFTARPRQAPLATVAWAAAAVAEAAGENRPRYDLSDSLIARHRPGSSCLPLQLRVMAMPPASRSPHGAVGHAIEVLMARICRTVRRLVLREFP